MITPHTLILRVHPHPRSLSTNPPHLCPLPRGGEEGKEVTIFSRERGKRKGDILGEETGKGLVTGRDACATGLVGKKKGKGFTHPTGISTSVLIMFIWGFNLLSSLPPEGES